MSNINLTKTCSICGLQKPLSAFLQLGGPHGASYGIVCASCRSAGLDKKRPKESEDSSSSTSGRRVDAKLKVESEEQKREEISDKQEKYYKERELEQLKQGKKTQARDRIAKEQQQHREGWLKRGFLDTSTKPTQTHGDSPADRALKEQITDFSNPVEDTRVAGTIKLTSAERSKFAASLPAHSEVRKRFFSQADKQAAEKKVASTAFTDALEKKFSPKK